MAAGGTILGQLLAETYQDADNDVELQQQLRTMLVAGHDTTASALAWALYHIHREDGVRDRLARNWRRDLRRRRCPSCRTCRR